MDERDVEKVARAIYEATSGPFELIERLRACANGVGLFKSAQGDYGICDEAASAIAALVVERDRQADQLAEIAEVVSQARREADRMSPETALYVFSRIDGIARAALAQEPSRDP